MQNFAAHPKMQQMNNVMWNYVLSDGKLCTLLMLVFCASMKNNSFLDAVVHFDRNSPVGGNSVSFFVAVFSILIFFYHDVQILFDIVRQFYNVCDLLLRWMAVTLVIFPPDFCVPALSNSVSNSLNAFCFLYSVFYGFVLLLWRMYYCVN